MKKVINHALARLVPACSIQEARHISVLQHSNFFNNAGSTAEHSRRKNNVCTAERCVAHNEPVSSFHPHPESCFAFLLHQPRSCSFLLLLPSQYRSLLHHVTLVWKTELYALTCISSSLPKRVLPCKWCQLPCQKSLVNKKYCFCLSTNKNFVFFA